MKIFQDAALVATLTAAAALFGFFYAWSVSAMWGLDVASPLVAIAAMNAVNSTVQNGAFALSFFGAPVLLVFTSGLTYLAGRKRHAVFLALALLTCVLAVHVVTFTFHIPLNQNLMSVGALDESEAAATWFEYSESWKFWNWVRTFGSGGVVVLLAMAALPSNSSQAH